MRIKKAVVLVAAVLGISLAVGIPQAEALTRSASAECGSLPSKLHVDINIVQNDTTHSRTVTVRGYGVGYNGYKYQVTGPHIWQWDYSVYNRTTLMATGSWYGRTVTGLNALPILWTGRILSGSRYCEVSRTN